MKKFCPNSAPLHANIWLPGAIACIFCLATALILFSGGKSEPAGKTLVPVSKSYGVLGSPTNFVHQIAKADHTIITNRFSESGYVGFSLTISGHQMKDIIHAISKAKGNPYEHSLSVWDWQLQFYQRTNLLGVANFQGSSILIDMEYFDDSSVFDKLYDEILAKTDLSWKKPGDNEHS